MNRLASHRGPDGEGYWIWNGQSATGQFVESRLADQSDTHGVIALGHCRLAILDLSAAGRQPMASKDRRVWIVFNGEIYNYLELRDELIQLGYTFTTGTDTEVILAAYDRWGTECFARFNGMWGLAIADVRRRVVVLSRDRLGVKPLYVWAKNGALAFASEIKQFGFDHRVGHMWPLRMMPASSHTSVLHIALFVTLIYAFMCFIPFILSFLYLINNKKGTI